MKFDEIKLGGNALGLEDLSEGAFQCLDAIESNIRHIKDRYIELGFHLREMWDQLYYMEMGYSDFYECVEENFHLDKSAASRCIGVWKEFADQREKRVLEEYAGYSYSQLVEMLPLEKSQRKKITVDMSVSQIRAYKKSLKTPKDKPEKETVATSQPKEQEVPEALAEEMAALETVASQQEEVVEQGEVQSPFPDLKNMTEREEFVNGYKDWKIWCKNELTEETFYRYDLPDGAAIVVKSYLFHPEWLTEEREETELYLLTPGYRHFADCKKNMTAVKEYLKDLKNKASGRKKK